MSEKLVPSADLLVRIRTAFLAHGYDAMSMVTLAKACGFTRRSLYNYFSNKEEAFRSLIRFDNIEFVRVGMAAGEKVRREDGSALDIVAATLDARYGFARRLLHESPHAVEISAEAFRRCRDIMIDTAMYFHNQLEHLLLDLERDGLLRINPDIEPHDLARMLADGGRAINQALPPVEPKDFSGRYRAITEAILYGTAESKTSSKRAAQR